MWVTPEEKAAIAAKADAHSWSASIYLRRLGLALPVESTVFRAGVPRPGDAGELTFVGLRSDDIKKGRNENSREEPVWQACGAILFRRVLLNHQLGPVRCA